MLEEKDLQAIRAIIKEEAGAVRQDLRQELGQIGDRLGRVEGRLDFEVGKKLDAINEGIDTILETMVSKSRVEQLAAGG